VFLADPSIGEHADNNDTLKKENDLLRAKCGKMAEEANAQKAVEVQNETIAQLCDIIERRTKEVGLRLVMPQIYAIISCEAKNCFW
jgi:hypothetical protein